MCAHQMTQNSPEENIYLTAKTRMTSEAKLRKRARYTRALISWYSFCLIVMSLLDLTSSFKMNNFSLVSILCSIGIFGLSLFWDGENNYERAENYRQCYLKLQKLYRQDMDTNEKLANYADILDRYENQTGDDYNEMLFDAFIHGQELRNSIGIVKITFASALKVIAVKTMSAAFWISLAAVPIVLGYSFREDPHEIFAPAPNG